MLASDENLLSYLRALPHARQLGVLEGLLALPSRTAPPATGACTSALDRLVACVKEDAGAAGPSVVRVFGAAGSGKSSLMARLVSRLSGASERVGGAGSAPRKRALCRRGRA